MPSPEPDPQRWPPNRVLNLADLERPLFRQVGRGLEELLEEKDGFYLHPSKRWEYPWALEQVSLHPGCRVLDAGCGGSIFPCYLAHRGMRVSAVDYCLPPGIAGRDTGVEYLRGDLCHLPFADQTFSLVFCISVLEHLPREKQPLALQELRRVLCPGGLLLLTTDFHRHAAEKIWYQGDAGTFPVDWAVFDQERLTETVLCAPGFQVRGDVDLRVDWEETIPRMRAFHGYPYTSVGLVLQRA